MKAVCLEQVERSQILRLHAAHPFGLSCPGDLSAEAKQQEVLSGRGISFIDGDEDSWNLSNCCALITRLAWSYGRQPLTSTAFAVYLLFQDRTSITRCNPAFSLQAVFVLPTL